MHTPDSILMYPVAHIRSDFPTKFGIPKQSGLSQALEARVVFCPEYRSADAVRGLEEFSHIWLLWQFSAAVREGETFSPTVRPPRLGGNKRVGVFASRSPFRPNHIGLSCVKLERIDYTGEGPVLIVRGADLMDGTPILDVKPYLPYADSRPDARRSRKSCCGVCRRKSVNRCAKFWSRTRARRIRTTRIAFTASASPVWKYASAHQTAC